MNAEEALTRACSEMVVESVKNGVHVDVALAVARSIWIRNSQQMSELVRGVGFQVIDDAANSVRAMRERVGTFSVRRSERAPKVGEVWLASGLWSGESQALVRIVEVLESGNVDVNYELDETKVGDMRILPAVCLIMIEEEMSR